MMSLPRAGCERCAGIFSKPNAIVPHGWVLALFSHVELLVLTATMAFSTGLGLAMARATIFIVFSLMTRNIVGTNRIATASSLGLAYENHTIQQASHAA